jgi:hypothetical protein
VRSFTELPSDITPLWSSTKEADFILIINWGLVYLAENLPFSFATFSTLSPSHHIKYTKKHMFGVVNVGKKIN